MSRRSGLLLVLVGPDGSGKSTIARGLAQGAAAAGCSAAHFHWRPGILPRAGDLIGRRGGDVSRPHGQEPQGPWLSRLRLIYYWLDFLLGTWVKVRPILRKGGVVIMERGWWDFGIDPRRYRLQASPRLVETLGRLLPHPDLNMVLEARGSLLARRKAELPPEELDRQRAAWRRARIPSRTRVEYLDAEQDLETVQERARELMFDALREPSTTPLEEWLSVPGGPSPRWLLPRTPSGVARNGLSVYQPVTLKGLAGWELARAGARLGAFRLLPSSRRLPDHLAEALRPHLPPAARIAVARANHSGRYVVLAMNSGGDPLAVAKVALADGRQELQRERDSLETWAPMLPAPLHAPKVLAFDGRVLLLEAIEWRPRVAPWRLPDEVAYGMGVFFRKTASAPDELVGWAHGDFAPWNLLLARSGWFLLDWESAHDHAPPFFDIFHFLVQSNQELRKPSRGAILRGIRGLGRVGGAIRAYSEGSGIPVQEAPGWFSTYVSVSIAALDPTRAQDRIALRVRRDFARRLTAARVG